MVKNGLTDLNNFLFGQLERLDNDDMSEDELKQEIDRSKAMTTVANQIISNASLGLEAERLKAEYGGRQNIKLPEMLENKE